LMDIAPGADLLVAAGRDLAGRCRVLYQAILSVGFFRAGEQAHTVIVASHTDADLFLLLPVALCAAVHRRPDIHIATGVQIYIAAGADSTTSDSDIALGLQRRIALCPDVATNAGAAVSFLPGLLGRGERHRTLGGGNTNLLPVALTQAV